MPENLPVSFMFFISLHLRGWLLVACRVSVAVPKPPCISSSRKHLATSYVIGLQKRTLQHSWAAARGRTVALPAPRGPGQLLPGTSSKKTGANSHLPPENSWSGPGAFGARVPSVTILAIYDWAVSYWVSTAPHAPTPASGGQKAALLNLALSKAGLGYL